MRQEPIVTVRVQQQDFDMNEELEHIKKTVHHPDHYALPCYIALGYPAKNAELPVQKVINVENRIHINQW